MKRLVWVLISVFTVLLLTPGAASANTTKITWAYDDYHFANHDCGFKVVFRQVGPYKYADQYDNDGNLYREIVTAGGGSYHISATANGTTLTTEASYQLIYDYNPDGSTATIRQDGLHLGFTIPGEGLVLFDTGRIVFDAETGEITFAGGPHMLRDGDVEKFCAAFD
jgi:hypothetical protein